MLKSVNPATGEVIGEVAPVSREQVFETIVRARAAQKEWGALPVSFRLRFLKKLRGILCEEAGPMADLLCAETGKPVVDALAAEILPSLLWLDYVVSQAGRLLKSRRISSGLLLNVESRVEYHPLGVVGIITPWNFPLFITLSSALSALAAGNAVVTKPSHFTPLCIVRLGEMMVRAGFPPDVFQVLPGDAAVGEAMIGAGVDKVVFTGSTATGKQVAAACAERLIPFTLELGGKDAMIVLEDAPMPRAVQGALFGGFCHSGQICMSVERVYVVESLASEFVSQLKEVTAALRLGVEIGPIQNEVQLRKVESQVAEAVRMGATVLTGGRREEGGGLFFSPTVLTDVPAAARASSEETFGPVILVRVVKDADEAVRLANASAYGLTASVWTRNITRGRELAKRLEAANIYINDHMTPAGNPHAPWGGAKESGVGRQRGEWGIYSMVEMRHIARSRFAFSRDPFWFPRTERQKRLALALIRGLFSDKPVEKLRGFFEAVRAFLAG